MTGDRAKIEWWDKTKFNQKSIVDKYLGTPYLNHGRSLEGLDCWGLVIMVYNDVGVEVFDLENYDKEWARRGKNLILGNYYENWQPVKDPQLGDVLLFRYPKDVVSHAGIMLTKGRFIQATENGVIVSRCDHWFARLHGAYRWVKKQN